MGEQKYVIYTAIFGKKDFLRVPRIRPANAEFVCFTDQDFTSKVWKIKKISPPVPGDPTRSARRIKILPHEYFPEYDVSIWIDGNVYLKKDPGTLIEKYLSDSNLAVLDCSYRTEYPLRTLKEELHELVTFERTSGKHQENADLMEKQWEAYHQEGFPDDNGMAWTMFLMRRHKEEDVVRSMNAWWNEISSWSKRDQMSFNYVVWKTGLRFNYIPLDGAKNEYFSRLNHYLSLQQRIRSYMIGAKNRILSIFYRTKK